MIMIMMIMIMMIIIMMIMIMMIMDDHDHCHVGDDDCDGKAMTTYVDGLHEAGAGTADHPPLGEQAS